MNTSITGDGTPDDASLRELVETLRARAERLESLDRLIASLKQETEHHRELADSLQRGLGLVQQVVEEREAFFNLSLDMLCIATTDGYFHKVNRAFERTLGYGHDELLSRPFTDFIHPDDIERTQQEVAKLAAGEDTITFENRYRHKDGSYRLLNWTTPAPVPGSCYLYAVARDVTEQRKRDERTLYEASHDPLTGLINRSRFNEEIHAMLTRLKRVPNEVFALFWMDLDQFKPVNDTYGHQAGDLVLLLIAARLDAVKRETDHLCRLGGDEFALLAQVADASEALLIAERLRAAIAKPIDIGSTSMMVDVSIGVALAPVHAEDVATLLRLADQAMYEAKRRHDGQAHIAAATTE